MEFVFGTHNLVTSVSLHVRCTMILGNSYENMAAILLGFVTVSLVAIRVYRNSCRIRKRDDGVLLTLIDTTLLDDSMAYLREYLSKRGWSIDTIPDDRLIREEMARLRSIYEDGASDACKEYTGIRASICSLVGVWKMQLGTKAMVKDVLGARTSWSTDRLNQVRRKDALWAWVYSRYYGPKRAHDLFLSDLYETVLMQTIVAGLSENDETVLDRLYDHYSRENKRKYAILTCDPDALARAAM